MGAEYASFWSDEEKATLRRLWATHGPYWDGWADELPGRSAKAIHSMACKLCLTKQRNRWTPEEDVKVLKHVVAAAKETGRSPYAVASRLQYLKNHARIEGAR